MIKKYITLAALLSAGTALVNASSEYRFTTTFQKETQQGSVYWNSTTKLEDTSNSSPSVISTKSGRITIKDQNGSTSALQGTGPLSYETNFIPIRTQLTGNGSWELTIPSIPLNYLYATDLKIKKVELYLGAFQTEGVNSGHWLYDGGNITCDFMISLGNISTTDKGTVQGNGNKLQSADGQLLPTGQGTGRMQDPVTLDFSSVGDSILYGSENQNSTIDIKMKVSGGNHSHAVGIEKIVVYADTYYPPIVPDPEPIVPTPTPPPPPSDPNLPEPSAFGLLAGLGALALVSARRRRK